MWPALFKWAFGDILGVICISPALAAKIYGPGVTCTIGNDADTAAVMNKMGATHEDCAVTDIVEDKARKLVTTPAYMLAQSISGTIVGSVHRACTSRTCSGGVPAGIDSMMIAGFALGLPLGLVSGPRAAPVVVGMMFSAAARLLRRSLCGTSASRWSFV